MSNETKRNRERREEDLEEFRIDLEREFDIVLGDIGIGNFVRQYTREIIRMSIGHSEIWRALPGIFERFYYRAPGVYQEESIADMSEDEFNKEVKAAIIEAVRNEIINSVKSVFNNENVAIDEADTLFKEYYEPNY